MIKRWYLVNGALVPAKNYRPKPNFHANIIGDIRDPFVSPVDGTFITSRSDLREHNRRNKVEQVGNDPAYMNPSPPKGEDESIADAIATEAMERAAEPSGQFRNKAEARRYRDQLERVSPVNTGDYLRMDPEE